MTTFVLRRLVLGVAALFVLVTVAFFLVEILIPFDHAHTFTEQLGAAGAQQLREELGLDHPLFVRYLELVGDVVRFNLAPAVFTALPVTLLIFGVGGLLALLFGSWLGRVVGWHRSRVAAGSITTLGVLLYTAFPPLVIFLMVRYGSGILSSLRRWMEIPIDSDRLWQPYIEQGFFRHDMLRIVGLGLFVSVVIAIGLRAWAKRRGWRLAAALAIPGAFLGVGLGVWAAGWGVLAVDAAVLRARGSVFTPLQIDRGTEAVVFLGEAQGSPLVTALAFLILAFGEVMFVMRTGMAEEIREDYVLTARAKGMPEHQVRDRHIARNAIMPTVSRFFMGVPWMLTGLIIIEWELAVAGLSTVFFNAVRTVNTPLMVQTLVVMGIIALVIWLVLDVVHAVLDPRVRRNAAEV